MNPGHFQDGASALGLWAVVLCWAGALVLGGCWLVGVLRARSRVPVRPASVAMLPPAWWRLMAWLIEPLSVHLGPWVSARSRFTLADRLRRAGLEGVLDADRYLAGVLAAGLLAALVAVGLAVPWGAPSIGPLALAASVGGLLPSSWLSDRIRSRQRSVLRQLPFLLDVITLSVQAGMNLSSALAQAADKLPAGPLRDELHRLMRDLRAGRLRADALRAMAERLALPAVASLVSTLLIAEQQGSALAPVLRAQAEQRRTERFLRAEKLAMQAPVKMLLPLLVFIFPCTFAVLLFPIFGRMLSEGWLK